MDRIAISSETCHKNREFFSQEREFFWAGNEAESSCGKNV